MVQFDHTLVSRQKIQSKDLSKFLQSPAYMWLFRRLPPVWGRRLLGLLGAYYFSRNERRRSAVIRGLEHGLAEAFSPPEAQAHWKRTRRGMVDHYYEKLFLANQDLSTISEVMNEDVSAEGLDLLQETLDQGRGAILVTGHFGAVEFIPCALSMWGYPVTVLVHCKTPAMRKRMDQLASHIGAKLLDPKAGTVFFDIMKELKNGRLVMTQCDELDNWRPYRDRRINFLGQNLGLDKSLDLLSKKSNAPVLFGLNHRLPGGKYRIVIERPEDHPAATGEKLVSAQCLSVLISNIYRHPEAWYEWGKLGALVEETLGEVDESKECLRLPGKMAVHASS